MAPWIGVYLTAPLVIFSFLFMLEVVRCTEEAYARLSFKSYDVRIAFQLIMFGFMVLAGSRVFDLFGLERLNMVASVVGGSLATVLMTVAFLILDVVVYGPGNPLYYHLPSNVFGPEDRYV